MGKRSTKKKNQWANRLRKAGKGETKNEEGLPAARAIAFLKVHQNWLKEKSRPITRGEKGVGTSKGGRRRGEQERSRKGNDTL